MQEELNDAVEPWTDNALGLSRVDRLVCKIGELVEELVIAARQEGKKEERNNGMDTSE